MRSSLVELLEVDKVYGTREAPINVLKQVSLSIAEGEFVGVIGASGSGKTTLMNILGCLDKPTRGRYLLSGQEVSGLKDDSLSSIRNTRIGFVFQSFNLISEMTVLENVEVPLFYMKVPKRKRKDKCLGLLESVGLSHRLDHYPSQLSGGESQRTAIARALVNDPDILLADEPTGNLDTKSGNDILELCHQMNRQGRTIIMVTHNMEIAGELPRTVEMSDGRVLSDNGREIEEN